MFPAKLRESRLGRVGTRVLALSMAACLAVGLLLAVLVREPTVPAPPVVSVPLAATNTPLRIHPGLGGVFLVLPDGTLWLWGQNGLLPRSETPRLIDPSPDWAMAAGGNNGFVAIKQNGELWQSGWSGGPGLPVAKIHRVGSDSDWRQAARCDTACAALKTDGSLWTWGTSMMASSLGDPSVSTRPEPGRVGTNLWVSLATDGSNYGFLGLTDRGQLLAWGLPHQPGPSHNVPTPIHPGTNWASTSMRLFLDRDHVLWSGPVSPFQPISAPGNIRPVLTNTVPGRFAEAGLAFYDIRPDGTLWRHQHPHRRAVAGLGAPAPGRVGDRSDWSYLWYGGGTVLGLTRDGTVWAWGLDCGAEPVPSLTSRLKQKVTDALNRVGRLAGLPPLNPGTMTAQSPVIREPRPLIRFSSDPPLPTP